MQHKAQMREDYYRAVFLLKNRFNTVNDLVKYWAYAGACDQGQPEIENINQNLK
jgi:hypothetical protein